MLESGTCPHLVCAKFLGTSSDSHRTAQSSFLVRRWRKELEKRGDGRRKTPGFTAPRAVSRWHDLPFQESGVCLDRPLVGLVLIVQWCPTLCDLMDYSPPGSSVHGTLQARILEWGAIPFSRGSWCLRD